MKGRNTNFLLNQQPKSIAGHEPSHLHTIKMHALMIQNSCRSFCRWFIFLVSFTCKRLSGHPGSFLFAHSGRERVFDVCLADGMSLKVYRCWEPSFNTLVTCRSE